MLNRRIYYRLPEIHPDTYFPLDVVLESLRLSDTDQQGLAEEAAATFHEKHSGQENQWPIVFSLHATKGSTELARFQIERKYEPRFVASRMTYPVRE